MNNPDQIAAPDDELLDAAIAASLLSAPARDSKSLQDRILYETTGLAQSELVSERTAWLPHWLLLKPQFALAASAVACAAALLMVYSPNQTTAVAPEPFSASVLTPESTPSLEPQAASLDVDQEPLTQLVWDEVLLLEDELAFANL